MILAVVSHYSTNEILKCFSCNVYHMDMKVFHKYFVFKYFREAVYMYIYSYIYHLVKYNYFLKKIWKRNFEVMKI